MKKEIYSGFNTKLNNYIINLNLNEELIKKISLKKNEPQFILNYRLKALQKLKIIKEPRWANLKYKLINYNNIIYYSTPKNINDNINAIKTYKKLGVPINEQKNKTNLAIDMIFDSISIGTTFKEELLKYGIIFCSINEGIKKYPNIIKKYLGSTISYSDNYYTALNSAVFSDGSFCYIPKNIKCPMDLSTYFRINNSNIGQFERTLIIADYNSKISYLEGCTAPIRNNNQIHSAIVEIIGLKKSKIKYSTVQNWYIGNKFGIGGIYNFVTKRGVCLESKSKISWNQIEIGSSITWKYPSIILKGNKTIGEFYSISITNNYQQIDSGTKIIHIGKNSNSTILSKSISMLKSKNTYRSILFILNKSINIQNYTKCDSILLDNNSSVFAYPIIKFNNFNNNIFHEATNCQIKKKQLLYCYQRNIKKKDAICIIINGFCKNIINKLPIEYLIETQRLLDICLEKINK